MHGLDSEPKIVMFLFSSWSQKRWKKIITTMFQQLHVLYGYNFKLICVYIWNISSVLYNAYNFHIFNKLVV